jgi:hypothetical protein
MLNITSLKRGATVTLQSDARTLSGEFKAGEAFKFLGWYASFARLSRVSDKAKIMVLPEVIGYTETLAPAQPLNVKPANPRYGAPHSDESGPSRAMIIATCLAGKDSGQSVMHVTPKEEREYNAGMAELAELFG